MSSDDLQKLREAHERIARNLHKLAGNEPFFAEAKASLAKLRESLAHIKGSRYAPLTGAITGLAVVGVGYLATELVRQKPTEKWADRVKHRTGTAERNL